MDSVTICKTQKQFLCKGWLLVYTKFETRVKVSSIHFETKRSQPHEYIRRIYSGVRVRLAKDWLIQSSHWNNQNARSSILVEFCRKMLFGLFFYHRAEMVECTRLDVNRTRRRVVMPFLALQKNNRNPIASTQRRSTTNKQRRLQLATISNIWVM